MVRNPDVPVVISAGACPLRWLDGEDRNTVWRREIAPNFHDSPGWKPPPGAPGQNPYHAPAWRRGKQAPPAHGFRLTHPKTRICR
jgi:hypothetical protein